VISPSGVQVDILPFGEIEIDDGVHLNGEGLTVRQLENILKAFED
jgi:hypothetical protein